MNKHEGRCFYCNVSLTITPSVPIGCPQILRPTDFTFDHFLSLAMGGENTLENLVACCRQCNAEKADGLPFVPVCRDSSIAEADYPAEAGRYAEATR